MAFDFNKDIVVRIINSEKSCRLRDAYGIIAIIVKNDSDKDAVAAECSKVFGVDVKCVNMLRYNKTGRVFRGKRGVSKFVKKAYVKVPTDSGFDFSKLQ